MNRFGAAACMVVAFALVGCDGGQGAPIRSGAPAATAAEASRPEPPRNPARPLDMAAKNLGVGYSGADCNALVAALRSKSLKKDQYETTKEYNARLEKIKAGLLLDEVKIGDALAFVDAGKGFSSYDADRGVLRHESRYTSYNLYLGQGHPMLVASRDSLNERSYEASNAYGAKVQVSSKREEVCVVTFANLPFEGLDRSRKFQLKMAGERARQIEGAIRVAYVGTLMPPYLEQYKDYKRPEISSPQEQFTEGYDLRFRLRQIWLIDGTSGDVLEKRTIK